MSDGIVYASVDVAPEHNLLPNFVHTNLQAFMCACKEAVASVQPRPQTSAPDGGICFACGGITVRTGTCTTCTECGTSGGCG